VEKEPPNPRTCGTCTLCCRLLPVRELEKPRDRWCSHCVKESGCGIYDERPRGCREWSCLWLQRPGDLPEHLRPDRCKVIVDVTKTGDPQHFMLWVHPDYPDAYKAPEFQRLMQIARDAGLHTYIVVGNKPPLMVRGK
jgi:hypothetical protein